MSFRSSDPSSAPSRTLGSRVLPESPLRRRGEVDLADRLRRRPGRNRARLDVAGDDRVGADHAALADADSAGHRAADPEPAVGADLDRALAREPLPGDRLLRVVVAVLG